MVLWEFDPILEYSIGFPDMEYENWTYNTFWDFFIITLRWSIAKYLGPNFWSKFRFSTTTSTTTRILLKISMFNLRCFDVRFWVSISSLDFAFRSRAAISMPNFDMEIRFPDLFGRVWFWCTGKIIKGR